jgi:TonB family protein
VGDSTIVVQSPSRPRIGVASVAFAPPRVANIRERLSPLPSVPEPAAAIEPTNANVVAPLAVTTAEPAKGAAVAMPIALQRVQPDYPVREKIRGVTGKVELQFGLAADGSVIDVSVLDSTPEHVFDRTAIAALKQWRFATPVDTGQRYTQTFAFTHGAAASGTESCREIIGSHICRHVAGDDTDH